jgi:hypothetical protein
MMNILSNYGVSAYSSPTKIDLSQLSGKATKSSALDSTKSAGSANTVDQVTISEAAKELAAKENNATQPRTPAQERLLKSASSDPENADKIASDMASASSTIFYDIRDVRGNEPVNKLSSGRIIDDAFKQKFSSEASVIDAQRLAIYNSETKKGTDPVQILSKMIDFTNSQSRDYLEASGWAGPSIADYHRT